MHYSSEFGNSASIFRARSKQMAFLFFFLNRKGTPEQKSRASVTHSLSPYKPFSEMTQRRWAGIIPEITQWFSSSPECKPWKRKLVSYTLMGWAGSPKSFKKEGKCTIRSQRQYSGQELCGWAGTGHARPWRKGCSNPLPHDASLEWQQQLKSSTQWTSLWGFHLVFFSFLLASTKHLGRRFQLEGIFAQHPTLPLLPTLAGSTCLHMAGEIITSLKSDA